MTRNTCLAVLAVLAFAASSQATVMVSADAGIDTPGLAGYKTYQISATSNVPGEAISVIDFIGDPDNNDPTTARGFFGAEVHQVQAGGQPTPFNNFNFFLTADQVLQDSQFKFNNGTDVTSGTGFFKESDTSLRALFGKDGGFGESVVFAQVVIPTASAATVSYRGVFSVTQGGTIVDLPEVSGTLPGGALPGIAPVVPDFVGLADTLGEVVNIGVVKTTGDEPITWSALTGPVYTPGFGALPTAPGLGSATFSFNVATQQFQFNTLGATRGTYVFSGTATNATGADPFSISVDVTVVPEPATLSLIGLALVGFVGFARKRS